ncbi:hypothetical protein ABDK56_11365 [Sphingomonas sp. ASV193]|uniref:hypothetical protein n=1 Tax=Sphingomonas sp. ASV193 TaxID=3144405 RepID=UPI0032E901BC
MKAREERQKVLIRARLCCDGRWSDACIVNLSSRGLGLQAADPPGRGTYVEIRRGLHVIVARVTWSNGRRFGAAARDRIAVASLIRDSAPPAEVAAPVGERRAAAGVAVRAEQSRLAGRSLEYAATAAVGAVLATAIGGLAYDLLGETSAAVALALGG